MQEDEADLPGAAERMASRPAHVPPDLLADFDIYDPPGAREDVHGAWRSLQDGPPVVWTPRNGGHWIATRAADISAMQLDYGTFSHTGLTVPRNSTPSLPLELDPPEHGPFRAILSPLFAPEVLAKVERRARRLAGELLDGIAPLGRCDFQRDFARHLPIDVFLTLMDLPLNDRLMLLGLSEKRVRSAVAAERDEAKAAMIAYMAQAVEERRARPGEDFISRILQSPVGGRAMTSDEAENMLATMLSGGLDTVASSMGFAVRWLAVHSDARAELVADPALIPRAVDELLRRHGVVNTARLVTRDVEWKGAHLREGEQIVLPSGLVGLDPDRFDDPLAVDFRRPGAGTHGAFGGGVHRCPGANLGRLELRIVLETWLERIPEFELDAPAEPVMASGIVNTVRELPLRWPVG